MSGYGRLRRGFPTIRQRRLLAMLVTYVDDSGSEPNGYAFVLAGFIAPAEQWVRFSDEWEKLCNEPPRTPDFRMTKAERLKGGGTYWGQGSEAELRARRDAKVAALSNLVAQYASFSVSAVMDWKNYETFARGGLKPEFDTPYFFLFWELIATVLQRLSSEGVMDRVKFIFDRQGKIGDHAATWHDKLIDTLPVDVQERMAGIPSFENDTDVLPLKAADMLAWHMRRYLRDKPSNAPFRPALASLLSMPRIEAKIPADRLRYIIREIQRGP